MSVSLNWNPVCFHICISLYVNLYYFGYFQSKFFWITCLYIMKYVMTEISRGIYNWIFKTLSAYKQKILQLNFT